MDDPDHALRVVANEAARRLSQRYDDLVPLGALRAGFDYQRNLMGIDPEGLVHIDSGCSTSAMGRC